MTTPLAQVIARADAARLIFHIGRETMMELCLRCTALVCDMASAACLGRQLKNDRQRAQYAAKIDERREQARAYYAADPDWRRAKSAEYQRDPAAAPARSVKRRMRYAAKRAAEGREVQPYVWSNPSKNKGTAPC